MKFRSGGHLIKL